MTDSFSIGTRSIANDIASGSRAERQPDKIDIQTYWGEIVKKDGDGYDVITYDDDGNIMAHYQRVMPIADGVEYSMGDKVTLAFEPGQSHPYIQQGAGGGGSTCSMAVNNFGVLFG
jgi:hypothetical protein